MYMAVDFRANLHNAEQRKFYGVFILVSPAEIAQAQHLAYVQGLYDFINRQGTEFVVSYLIQEANISK